MTSLTKSFVLLTSIYCINCFQNLWTFEPSHCEITNINKSFFNSVDWKCFKRSRLELFMNVTFNFTVDLESNRIAKLLIIGYQFRSNEYRKGPIEFSMGLCEFLASKDFDIPAIFDYSNLHQCPIKKNHAYYFKEYPMGNAKNLPPLIPEGRWKVELRLIYKHLYTIASINWYAKVVYPVPFRNDTDILYPLYQ